jgi:hypothetical protein
MATSSPKWPARTSCAAARARSPHLTSRSATPPPSPPSPIWRTKPTHGQSQSEPAARRRQPAATARGCCTYCTVRTSGSYPSSSLSSHSAAHSSSSPAEPASRPPPRAASLARARVWLGKRWWWWCVREAGAEGEGAATRGRLEKEAAAGGEGEGEALRRHFVEHLASSARSPWARAAAMLGGWVGWWRGECVILRIVCVSVRRTRVIDVDVGRPVRVGEFFLYIFSLSSKNKYWIDGFSKYTSASF